MKNSSEIEKLEKELEKLDEKEKEFRKKIFEKECELRDRIKSLQENEARSAAGEYYEKLVHVTSKCSDGRTDHYIGVIDANTVDGSSFVFKRGVTHILTENGKACGVDYDDYRGCIVDVYNTRELFTSGKTTYRDVNPRFHHDVEIRRTSKEDEEEFVNSAYNERLLECSNKIKMENERAISAMAALEKRSGEC